MSAIAKILIIDDNPKYIADALPMYGYEVDVALDGVQALQKLSQIDNLYDMVLLDVMMPNMDGWETLRAIRANKRIGTIPVIMITAVNEDSKQISGLKSGADDYITKPFILPNLLARIEALLRRTTWQKDKAQTVDYSFGSSGTIEPITTREKEILKMVAQGAGNKAISEALFVREVTVKTHLNSIFKKLKVANRTQAVLLAMQLKLID